MTRQGWRLSAELLPVTLVLACLAGSTVLVIATHQRYAADRKAKVAERPPKRSVEPPAPVQIVEPPPLPPLPPPKDPTPEILGRLAAETAAQQRAAGEADRHTASLELARRAAMADAKRWRQREMLVRAQADALDLKAQQLETDAESTALERDVLARQRDALRDKLKRDQVRAGSSFAILPYKGPNGTWQRPISLECHDGTVTVQPGGPTFTLLDLDEGLSPRSNAFIAAVAHELLKVQGETAPDGAPIVPYILFLVRPDGIRPYYEARARLEPLGINFGYELVDQGLEIDYPDLNDASEWDDGASPRPGGHELAGRQPVGGSDNDALRGDGPRVWPLSPSRARARASGELAGSSTGSRSPLQQALDGPPTYDSPRPPPLSQLGAGEGDAEPGGVLRGTLPPDDGRVEILPRNGRGPRPTVIVPPARLQALAERDGVNTSSQPVRPPQVAPGQLAPAQSGEGTWHADNAVSRPIASSAEGSDGSLSALPESRGSDGSRSALPESRGSDGSRSALPESRGSDGSRTLPESRPANDRQVIPGPASDRPGAAASHSGSAAGIAQGSPAGSPLIDMRNHSGKPISTLPMSSFSEPSRIPEQVLELVIECTSKGVILHPGGSRLSPESIKAGGGDLVQHLQQIVQRRRNAEPGVFWLPRLYFLVEPGGESTYWEVRKHTALAGTGWPVSLQVADKLRLIEQEQR